ncbi:Zn-dependent hydrolase lipoprotein [Leptospira ryugenii]|uniref:Zn-dependent hydrolase lipoprotein n=2 Tax=Leptospira ryugenii TaxID=1917863 RepID=A0A2P2E0G1_9LEPT|nr:Zn-dependent hydrolase lipoprotein [Leptospira ryugenii]
MIVRPFIRLLTYLTLATLISCQVTSHQAKEEWKTSPSQEFPSLRQTTTKIEFKIVKAADWEVPLSGLLDLNDPKAKGQIDRPEPISIYFYVIKHPKFGTYLIDSGVGKSFRNGNQERKVSSIVASQMNLEKLKIFHTTKEYLLENKIELKGVFFTHLHLDHVLGAYEIDSKIPFYVGPSEVTSKQFINLFVQGSTNNLLGEEPNLIQLKLSEEIGKISYLDFFGDESFFVISVPGHTAGSLAFYVQAKDGGHLVLGDSCHTQWGWQNEVIPGSFTADPDLNRKSLRYLIEWTNQFKPKFVYPGHQERLPGLAFETWKR